MGVLEAHDVTRDFREADQSVRILKGISMALHVGEIVTLEGPSGSGKTTLLSILGCILTPTTGRVVVEDVAVEAGAEQGLAEIRRRSIGFVFQQYNLFPALTALENVEYALNIKGFRGLGARHEAERVIDQVGLWHRRHALPCDLSGGQKQRVAIARALAGRSPIVLADEPTANLDTETGAQVLEVFRRLAKRERRALLIVTHDPRVRAISDRVLSIHDGRLAA